MALISKVFVFTAVFAIAVTASNNSTVNETTTIISDIATNSESTTANSVEITTNKSIEATNSTEAITTTEETRKETTDVLLTTTTVSKQNQSTQLTVTTQTPPPQVITDETLSTEMLIAIISFGMASFGLLVLVGVCVWYKTSKARRMSSFLKVLNDTDESMLYMVDYDDVALNHGRLHLQVSSQPLTPDA